MEELEAIKFSDEHIEFKERKQITHFMHLLEQGNNFMIYHEEKGKIKSQLMLASDLLGKVKSGDILITAEEDKK